MYYPSVSLAKHEQNLADAAAGEDETRVPGSPTVTGEKEGAGSTTVDSSTLTISTLATLFGTDSGDGSKHPRFVAVFFRLSPFPNPLGQDV